MKNIILLFLLSMSVYSFQMYPCILNKNKIIYPTYNLHKNYPLLTYSNSPKFPKISYKNIHSTNVLSNYRVYNNRVYNNKVYKRNGKMINKKKFKTPKMFVFLNTIEKYTINCYYNYLFSIQSFHCFPLSFVFKFKNLTGK